ncbi:sulfate ABC transporter permease subunit CysW [Pectinatus cerevisiiphilus]|uniref:Sulfate transport system permease protein n=1 Tax=Pectinatus cerevisiiphilus TaxID=86956 RepID=A0A4R3K835_9FIRM|nr:sulfate ABC transporter permease subunit CysW [Pectinatus cerevisiiphilus]TCS79025.1 sulfate transport system permease protein [Pectinatus cerevisiiphilus]
MGKGSFTKYLLITLSSIFIFVMLIMPLMVILSEAFKNGISAYADVLSDAFTLHALRLTLFATFVSVVCNTIFGLFAAWALTRFYYKRSKFLTTLIDIPFAISPVIAGLIFSLTFGRIGWAQPILNIFHIKIVFAVTGIVLVTIFVTLPFIARSVMPVLHARGTEEEEAAALMGAGGFTIFRKITFPHIKWALLYGIILCTARAMGEFGAVSVVSGHLRGKTDTLPLLVEILYNDFKMADAFAVSTILVLLALILLILKNVVEYKWHSAKE